MAPGKGGGVKLPAISSSRSGGGTQAGGGGGTGSSRAGGLSGKRAKAEHKEGYFKSALIKFQPASPGQVLEMAVFLGVDIAREFYLLPTVKRAVAAPFPNDWAVGHDQQGDVYYYNKFTMKVIAVHPLSDVFIGWVQDERAQKKEELAAAALEADSDGEDNSDDDEKPRRGAARSSEEMEERMGNPWMRFATESEGECFWFNFKTKKLHTPNQYNIIIATELQDRRKQAQPKQDKNKVAELEMDLKARKAMERAFATGLRKYWLRWTVIILELRAAQATALAKAGALMGKGVTKSFREWQQKVETLAMVRRAMAPLGGRRDKAFKKDIFNMWKEAVDDQLASAKEEDHLRIAFNSWRDRSSKQKSLARVKEVIRAMILGNSLSINFEQWKSVWEENKLGTMKVMEDAVLKIQRGYRMKNARKAEGRLAVSQRKQIKYKMLRLCEGIETTAELSQDDASMSWMHGGLPDPPADADAPQVGGSLAVYMLQGAMETSTDDSEKSRLRQMVRIINAKASVQPGEAGYGAASIRDDIARVVDLIDPVDRTSLRATLDEMKAQNADAQEEKLVAEMLAIESGVAVVAPPVDAEFRAVSPGHLEKLAGAVKNMVTKLTEVKEPMGKIQKENDFDASSEAESSQLLAVAQRADQFLSSVIKPEGRSATFKDPIIVDDEINYLEDLDTACEALLSKIERHKAQQGQWE